MERVIQIRIVLIAACVHLATSFSLHQSLTSGAIGKLLGIKSQNCIFGSFDVAAAGNRRIGTSHVPSPAVCQMNSGTSELTRKEKNRNKKLQRQQESSQQQEMSQKRKAVIESLLEQISAEKRDVDAVARDLAALCDLRPAAGLKDALIGDWKLRYVNDADTLHSFGTGLGKLPGTSILDAWAAFTADGRVTVHEVCRVVGPFPNIRNTLDGAWELRGRAAPGFGSAAAAPAGGDGELRVTYEKMTDGRGRVTTAETGFRVRELSLEVAYWGSDLLVIRSAAGPLVLSRDPDMAREMARQLRVDPAAAAGKPPPSLIEGIAAVATGAKKPWEIFRP